MDTRIIHRQLTAHYPTIAGGEGVYLTDTEGKRYLDGSGGAAVSCLGHGHPKVIEAIKRQLDQIAFAHSAYFTNEAAERLADWLTSRAPEGFGSAMFVSGGSEATEAALKFARQVHVERGHTERTHFIGRRQSYHGTTLGALSIGGHVARRRTYEPMLSPTMSHIGPCYAYRHQREGESAEAYGHRAAAELEAEVQRLGPETVAAFVAETVVGATAGAIPPAPGYFKEIRRICDRHGVLLILDEVMCGMGRTGTLYACEQEGVSPDMITMAKGLGAGYQPIGAVLVRRELAETVHKGTGALEHGHTYMGHATACAGALAVQQVIEEDGLLARVRERGAQLMQRLQDKFGQHPHVGDIRGRGLFIGVEMVADRETREPFPVSARLAGRIKQASFDNGLIVYPAGGTADGVRGDHILIAPPFIISEAELDVLVTRLESGLTQALAKAAA